LDHLYGGETVLSAHNFAADGKVEIILVKGVNSETWWSCVQKGHPQIEVKDIEGAKYLDDSILKKIYEQVTHKISNI
jgi:hypothetical protein